jgi:uncharacterized protein (UPF0303 family)
MTLENDIARLKIQEERLTFQRFDEADAWRLGSLMRERAEQRNLPLVMDIRVAGRPLFYTALPQTTPDNPEWVRRKINVVMKYHKSSYLVGRELALSGQVLNEARGVYPIDMAPHGGGFPIRIRDVGVVGTVTVSGIPQREDHQFVTECIAVFLGVPFAEIALAAESK